MIKYTVILTDEAGSPYPAKQESFNKKPKAIKLASQWAKEFPDKLVFIDFFRTQDGQQGYINKDGADITGKSWTSN